MKLSRISKLLIDAGQATADEAKARREDFAVTLRCGADVAQSRTLQIAVLTAAGIAARCFPGAVTVVLDPCLSHHRIALRALAEESFTASLASLLGPQNLRFSKAPAVAGKVLLFGDLTPQVGALRVTYDGWLAQVGPSASTPRLAERPLCALAGVLAGSLALSEIFLAFAELNIAATRRLVGLSLWRPDLPLTDPEAQGPQVEVPPRELWLLGLGHLGNAYLWCLAALPYLEPEKVELYLNDFDKVESENSETGLLFAREDEGAYKTRVCSTWLEARGFETRLIERPFGCDFRCRPDEPRLAFCGFDSNPARRLLPGANFARVIESGLGGTRHNFDTIRFHTLPNPRPAVEIWPDQSQEEQERQAQEHERTARENPAYADLAEDICGRAALAGKSVAVPFVGVTAATLVVAEALRMLHDGPAYSDITFSLSDPSSVYAIRNGNYVVQDAAEMSFCDAEIEAAELIALAARAEE
jgi:hypothetical protein